MLARFDNKNAITTEQKRDVLDRLMIVWMLHPNLRPGQLLLNCFQQGEWYFFEDSLLIKKIEEFYQYPYQTTNSSPLHQFMENLQRAGLGTEEIVRMGYAFAYNTQFEKVGVSPTERMLRATSEVRAIADELRLQKTVR